MINKICMKIHIFPQKYFFFWKSKKKRSPARKIPAGRGIIKLFGVN